MNKLARFLVVTIAVILFLWAILTVIAESKGRRMQWKTGSEAADKKVLIIYDPDPFYNLDEQVCRIFAAVMAKHNMHITVSTVAAAHDQRDNIFDLYVFCANTYNWRPDWAVSGFIRKLETLKGRPVVSVTLGSGSTKASQKHLEQIIRKKGANIIGSRSFWLLRPNDESRIKESNVKVALSMVDAWAQTIATQMNGHP